jgi:PAS domain S-box-containing protein
MHVSNSILKRYRDLQGYVGWSSDDEANLLAARPVVSPVFSRLVDDFYEELQRHPDAAGVITGGTAQIERLKQTLLGWLEELFSGDYDDQYVGRRWRIGLKHVEIGLAQVYATAALSRLRTGLIRELRSRWTATPDRLAATLLSLNRLIDLDLAVMSDAYETEYVHRQREAERQQLNDLLQREKELSAGLLTHAQAAVVILDREGQIVRSNPYLETLLADSPIKGAEERDWFTLFLAGETREKYRDALLRAKAEMRDKPVFVSSVFEQRGYSRHLHWAGVSLLDGEGRPFAVLVIGHDVTDLFEAQQKALQAERLAAIGQMATGLAHESRNALQRIGASAEMLEMEVEGNATALELLRRIDHAKTHLHQLLEEVRTYAAPVLLDRSTVRITELWREAWELLRAQRAGRDVRLLEKVNTAELTVEVDRFRMVQVFRNLLENALAAAPDPAAIEIECNRRIAERFAFEIAVRDNGPGLSAEQQRRIFEPFFTTKPTGTGLGTAIAKRLVEAHGGTIAARNHAHGAEILIVLPASEG